VFDIFAAPRAQFTRLKDKPAWLVPAVIVIVCSMAAALVTAQFVDWTEQRDKAVEQMRGRNMSEEDIAKATEGMERILGNPLVRFGGPLVNGLIITAIGLLILAVVYNVCLPLLGASGNFARTLAVVCNAALVTVPGLVLRMVLNLITRSAEASTSLAALFPGLKSGFLVIVLSRLDPFVIWQLLLAGLGLNVVFDLKGTRSYWLVFSVWGLTTVLFALLGARAVR
jgi:hypothetical protein